MALKPHSRNWLFSRKLVAPENTGATINISVDPQVKSDAESIFSSLGMTLAEAINVFLHKSVMVGGLPFDVRQPRYNAETEAAIAEARDIMSGKARGESFDSAADMFATLDE